MKTIKQLKQELQKAIDGRKNNVFRPCHECYRLDTNQIRRIRYAIHKRQRGKVDVS